MASSSASTNPVPYQEALGLFSNLSQNDRRYAGNVARIEASLRELDAKVLSPGGQTK